MLQREERNCLHRLRINYIDKTRKFTEKDEALLRNIFEKACDAIAIDGFLYLGFANARDIQRAFALCGEFKAIARRMIDPYALHVTLTRYQCVRDVEHYFKRYGRIACITEHVSSKGRYAFVNFMDRVATLRALYDGSQHLIKGSRVKIRSKVLSAAEPVVMKPWSPARFAV